MFNNWKLKQNISDGLMPGILRFRPELMKITPDMVERKWPNFTRLSYSEKLELVSSTLSDNLKRVSISLHPRRLHSLDSALECDACMSLTSAIQSGWKTLFGTGEAGAFLSLCPKCFNNEIETGTILDNGKFLVDYILDSENALKNFLDPPNDFILNRGSNPRDILECSPEISKFSLQLVETTTSTPQARDADESIQAPLNSDDEIELPDDIESETPALKAVENMASFDDYEEPHIPVQQQYDSEDQDLAAESSNEFIEQDYDSEKQKIIDDESFSAVDLEDDLPTQDPYYHGKPNTALAKELASLDPIVEDLPKKRSTSHSASPVSVPQPPKRKRVSFELKEPVREVESEIKLLAQQIVKDPKKESFLALHEEDQSGKVTEFSVSARDFRFTVVRSPSLDGITSTEFSRMIHGISSDAKNTARINKLLVYSIYLCRQPYVLSSRDERLWELFEKLEDTKITTKTKHIESLMESFRCSGKNPFTQNLENIILAFACSTYVNLWKSDHPGKTDNNECNRKAKKELSAAITDENTRIRLCGSTIAKFRAVENFLYTNTCTVSLLLCLPQMQLVNVLRVLYRYQSQNKPEITLVSLLQQKTFNTRFDNQWRLSKTLLDRNWCHRW